jgi:TonB family protein
LGLILAVVVSGILMYRKFAHSAPVPSPIVTPTTMVRTSPTTPTPPPMSTTGSLHVESTPLGATVSVDGESRGVTPLDLSGLALGSHEVKVEMKGFTSSVQTVDITERAPGNVKTALTRAAAAMGMAEIVSNPSGAAVSIDGSPAGPTPITDLKLKPGSHQVEIRREGYESWSDSVSIQPGKRALVDAVLRPIPRATPTPAVETVDTSRIYVNASSDVDVLARKVSGTSISYPSDRAPRMKSGEAVSVTVTYVVNENGDVTDVKVVESGGKVVDDVVLNAVRGWKYSPAMKKGVKIKVRATFKQTFRAG